MATPIQQDRITPRHWGFLSAKKAVMLVETKATAKIGIVKYCAFVAS
jgi:hypothetical protein